MSGYTASGTLKKKRGRKPKNQKAADAEATPSLAGGSKAPTSVNGATGDKDLEDDDEEDDQAEMAVEGAGAMTEAQIAEEHRVRAMLVDSFDPDQLIRYENWRAARLTEAVVKRVSYRGQGRDSQADKPRSSTLLYRNQYPVMSGLLSEQ